MAVAVQKYELTLQGGERRVIKSQSIKYAEHGVEFLGTTHSHTTKLVAFVPYDTLLLLEAKD